MCLTLHGCVYWQVGEYNTAMDNIRALSRRNGVMKIWVSPNSNYAVYSAAGASLIAVYSCMYSLGHKSEVIADTWQLV